MLEAHTKLEALLAAITSGKTASVRFGAAKDLCMLSESAPELLYPHFDFFVSLLGHENSILRWNAILIVGNLAPADKEQKLDGMLDAYLAPILGPHLIDAGNTIHGATTIAAVKPHLVDTIVRRILDVEHATYDTPECRNVALGHAITSLDCLYALTSDRHAVHAFVARQANNSRPATRKKAEKFLRKWPFEQPKIRIEELPPMCVASVRAFGAAPETEAWRHLREWAAPKGLWSNFHRHPIYGFNNPSPSEGKKEYGYELWIRVDEPDPEDHAVEFKQFEGGLFAVTKSALQSIGSDWQMLWDWARTGEYRWRSAQELEKPLNPDAAQAELVFELLLPVCAVRAVRS